jgi:hypothetical protein
MWHANYCETLEFNCHTPTNHEVELDFSPPTTTIVKLLPILSFQTWFVAQQTSSGQMGFKVHTWQLGSTLKLTSTPRTKNSTSMGLGPNNFLHVVTTTIITSLNLVPNAQVCVYLTLHITKLQLQTTFPKPFYIPHSTCIHRDVHMQILMCFDWIMLEH